MIYLMTSSIYFTFLAAGNLLSVMLYFVVYRQVLVGHLHNTYITHILHGIDFTNNLKQYQVFYGDVSFSTSNHTTRTCIHNCLRLNLRLMKDCVHFAHLLPTGRANNNNT